MVRWLWGGCNQGTKNKGTPNKQSHPFPMELTYCRRPRDAEESRLRSAAASGPPPGPGLQRQLAAGQRPVPGCPVAWLSTTFVNPSGVTHSGLRVHLRAIWGDRFPCRSVRGGQMDTRHGNWAPSASCRYICSNRGWSSFIDVCKSKTLQKCLKYPWVLTDD